MVGRVSRELFVCHTNIHPKYLHNFMVLLLQFSILCPFTKYAKVTTAYKLYIYITLYTLYTKYLSAFNYFSPT